MYVCICNAVTEEDIKNDPEKRALVGTGCGSCLPDAEEILKEENKEETQEDLEAIAQEAMDRIPGSIVTMTIKKKLPDHILEILDNPDQD